MNRIEGGLKGVERKERGNRKEWKGKEGTKEQRKKGN